MPLPAPLTPSRRGPAQIAALLALLAATRARAEVPRTAAEQSSALCDAADRPARLALLQTWIADPLASPDDVATFQGLRDLLGALAGSDIESSVEVCAYLRFASMDADAAELAFQAALEGQPSSALAPPPRPAALAVEERPSESEPVGPRREDQLYVKWISSDAIYMKPGGGIGTMHTDEWAVFANSGRRLHTREFARAVGDEAGLQRMRRGRRVMLTGAGLVAATGLVVAGVSDETEGDIVGMSLVGAGAAWVGFGLLIGDLYGLWYTQDRAEELADQFNAGVRGGDP